MAASPAIRLIRRNWARWSVRSAWMVGERTAISPTTSPTATLAFAISPRTPTSAAAAPNAPSEPTASPMSARVVRSVSMGSL